MPRFPARGGSFDLVDQEAHNPSDLNSAFKLAQVEFPGQFGVFYETGRPTKNALEQKWVEEVQGAQGDISPQDLMRKSFASMH